MSHENRKLNSYQYYKFKTRFTSVTTVLKIVETQMKGIFIALAVLILTEIRGDVFKGSLKLKGSTNLKHGSEELDILYSYEDEPLGNPGDTPGHLSILEPGLWPKGSLRVFGKCILNLQKGVNPDYD